jgi:hypothetical protein
MAEDIGKIKDDPDFLALPPAERISTLVDMGRSDDEIDAIMSGKPLVAQVPSYGQQMLSNAKSFGSGMVGGALHALNPIEIGKSLVRPDIAMGQQMQQGEEAFRQGKPIQGALRTAAASVPWVGPAAAGAVDTAMQFATGTPEEAGQAVGGALGLAAGAKLLPKAISVAGKAVPAAYEAVSKSVAAPKTLETASGRFAKALAPENTPGAQYFKRNFQEALPELHGHAVANESPWTNMADFAKSSREATDEFYAKNHSTLVKELGDTVISGDPIGKAIKNAKLEARPEQRAAMERVEDLGDKYSGQEFSLSQLADFRKSLNAKLDARAKLSGADRATLASSDPVAGAMERQLDAIRDTINTNVDRLAKLRPGETARVLRTYRSMLDVTERAEKRAPAVELADLVNKGTRLGATEAATKVGRAIGFRANPIAAGAAETLSVSRKRWNHPDNLIRSGRELLDQGSVLPPRKAGAKALAPPSQLQYEPQPPTPGQTVPLTIEPVPPPPTNPYLGPNRRRSLLDPAVVEEQRKRAAFGPERRKTVGEGASPSFADYMRYTRGEPLSPEAEAFFANFERTTGQQR